MTQPPPAGPPPSTSRPSSSTATLLATGGVLGALAASSCCILPFVLVSLGMGGAWMGSITALGRYHPYFMVATGGLLAGGFWLAYQRPSGPCGTDEMCAPAAAGRLVKTALWGATLLLVAVLLLPDLVPMFMEG